MRILGLNTQRVDPSTVALVFLFLFAGLSFAVTGISLIQEYRNTLPDWERVPLFVGGLTFALGVFTLQSAHGVLTGESLRGHIIGLSTRLFGQLNQVQALIEKNERLKKTLVSKSGELENLVKGIAASIDGIVMTQSKRSEEEK